MNNPFRSQSPAVLTLLALASLAGCTAAPPITPTAPSSTTANPPSAESLEIERNQKFARWVDAFRTSASAAGINQVTLQLAFDNVRFVPHAIEADRAQPEFTRSVWDYLDTAVSAQRLNRGKEKWTQLGPDAHIDAPIHAITARYGVPVETLIAIWGIESNYGSNMGDIPTIDALVTLGFEGRREAWARGQLLAALKILQNGDIARGQMVGSWAGAMGQTQFLPSNYLTYAVDADGDGLRDIWNSVPDVMASTANFLAHSGWKVGEPWGLEVRLPPEFDYARANADVSQTASAWGFEGVQAMDHTPLPALLDSTILLPAGARGPAFLVGPNFRTILRYNNSTSYALAVNLLAQQLAGGPGVQTPWPRDLQALSRSQLLALQTALNALGFDSGTPDGTMGPATQRGVRQYQRSLGLPADGYPTLDLLQRLQ